MATGKTMPPSKPCDVDSREEWLLRLLYTPDEDGRSRPLYGQTRIMKAVFLLQKKLEEYFDESVGFDFTAQKYGPHDNGVLEALECLQRKGYVEQVSEKLHSSEYEGDEFRLTENGKQEAKKLYNRRTERENRNFSTG